MLPETVTVTPDLDWLTAVHVGVAAAGVADRGLPLFYQRPVRAAQPRHVGRADPCPAWLAADGVASGADPRRFLRVDARLGVAGDAGVFLIWQSHYVYRAWIYPLHLAKASSPMPVLLMLMGLAFNLVNGSLHGAWLFVHPVISDSEWLGGCNSSRAR